MNSLPKSSSNTVIKNQTALSVYAAATDSGVMLAREERLATNPYL
jgi:hypothetical protein